MRPNTLFDRNPSGLSAAYPSRCATAPWYSQRGQEAEEIYQWCGVQNCSDLILPLSPPFPLELSSQSDAETPTREAQEPATAKDGLQLDAEGRVYALSFEAFRQVLPDPFETPSN